MTIQNIKELAKIVDLCRKKGIDSIRIDNIEIKLGRIERRLTKKEQDADLIDKPQLSEEDLLFWSSNVEEAV